MCHRICAETCLKFSLTPGETEIISFEELFLERENVSRFVLVVEKDATFQRLLDDGVCSAIGPCVLITGKGVPDLNTRQLVRRYN